ncbi:MAG: LacI family DNA-binding transcriptional regulator [Ruminiclostridium sp.]|nr:LacI family DNA-binding transcriptional regulator [Ruminiclostridium sp.]
MSESKKIIGLMLEDISSDYSRVFIDNARKAIPEKRGVRLAVISGRYTDSDVPVDSRSYSEVYNTVFQLGEMCGLDGLIIHPGTLNAGKMALLERTTRGVLRDIPKVIISSALDGYTTISYDNTTGIREAIEFLVNVDGITSICMLGGREDNYEANIRKNTYIECLRSHGIMFRPSMFEATDMWTDCDDAAERLLERNPDVRAIFCVNDSVAVGLYRVMERRGMVPGKDIIVFGFDNTRMAETMRPPLASVGAESATIGQRAVEMLLAKMNGETVKSEKIRTKMYGRASFDYTAYEYSLRDLIKGDRDFIYRMFDDCFYRYRNDMIDREAVDLKRLYYEFISRMLRAMNERYLSIEEFNDIGRLIDIFFDEDAMEYTDSAKLIQCVNRLQNAIAAAQKMHGVNINTYINRLFLRMKDKALSVVADKCGSIIKHETETQAKMKEFLVRAGMAEGVRGLFSQFGVLGIRNGAVYLFDEDVRYEPGKDTPFPDHVHPICVMKNGELYMMTDERRKCRLDEMLTRRDLSSRCRGYAVFPILCRDHIFGVFVSELEDDICARGELIAMELGRTIYLDRISGRVS